MWMDDGRLPKQVMNWEVNTTKRKMGRPRTNWTGTVRQDLTEIGRIAEFAGLEIAGLDNDRLEIGELKNDGLENDTMEFGGLENVGAFDAGSGLNQGQGPRISFTQ